MSNNYLAGGVNSPIPIPEYYPKNIVRGEGPYVYDKDGSRFVDMWMGYGALLFGHADPDIVKSIQAAVEKAFFFSYQTLIEKEYSEEIHNLIPSAELIRYATTGSDAVAYAIRLARTYTKRDKVLSILGGYHGAHEGMVSTTGTTIKTPPEFVKFNDPKAVSDKLESESFACMILEPVLANTGCTPPNEGYLQEIRDICTRTGTVLIFDEVVNGFRMSIGGSQRRFGVTPDLSIFSKAIAAGLPLSLIAGKKEIMKHYMPTGEVFFAGTFNGHPLSIAVAKTVLKKLDDGEIYEQLDEMGDHFRLEINNLISEYDLNIAIQGIGSMFTIGFGCKSFNQGITNENFDSDAYQEFIRRMAKQNILFPPLPTETVFLSPVHQSILKDIIEKTKNTLIDMHKENLI